MARIETIGDATLYLGDCREILPTLGKVDAVVTDPPYGLGDKWQGGNAASKGAWKLSDGGAETQWDRTIADPQTIAALAVDRPAIIWGGNYYDLAPVRGWLSWDKMQEHSSGHFEMAWTNIDIPTRSFRMCRAEAYGKGKFHPTEKPVDLMKWCLGFIPKAITILDPFMGSGTTGVAAVNLGRRFIGIEIEPKYFDIACKRVQAAVDAPDMFVQQPSPPTQVTFAEIWKEPYYKGAAE